MRVALTIAVLIALLAFVLWGVLRMWNVTSGPLPMAAYVAMGATIFFSLLIGCGLMALMFYSSRRGYDDAAGPGREN